MKMNKILAALSVMVLALASCQREGNPAPSAEETAEPGKITIDMNVTLPGALPETKDMAETEQIENIYVAVFGWQHYLNEFAKAIPIDDSGNVAASWSDAYSGTGYRARVTLTESSDDKYVHVLANVSQNPDFNAYENDVMVKTLFTASPKDGYWQYLEFPGSEGGICDATRSKFNNLKLIRNFARIDVQMGTAVSADWDFEAFEVYNTPSKGLFPVVTGTDGSGNYTYSTDYASKTFDELLSSYAGFKHPDAVLNPELTSGSTFPDNIPEAFAAGANTVSKYVYENVVNGDDGSTFIVIRLKHKNPEYVKYFRIDIENEDGRVPVLRNFHYTITVSGIGTSGYDTPRLAASHPTKSNVFAGLDISQLKELNNGISLLNVEYSEKVFCTAADGEFNYRFIPSVSNMTTYGDAVLSAPAGDTDIFTDRSTDWATGGTDTGSGGWRKVTYSVSAPGATRKTATFTVTGTNATVGTSVKQVIKIISMPKQDFGSMPSTVSKDSDDIYKLSFTLPDDLPQSMFPLTIIFDQHDDKIAPSRPGTLTEIEGSIIKYAKEITRATYESNKTVEFWFKSVRTITSGDLLYIRDRQATYFNETSVLINP